MPGKLQLAQLSPKLQDSKTDLAPDFFLSGEPIQCTWSYPFHLDFVTIELVLRLVFQIKDWKNCESGVDLLGRPSMSCSFPLSYITDYFKPQFSTSIKWGQCSPFAYGSGSCCEDSIW